MKKSFAQLLLFLVVCSCENLDLPKELPSCVEAQILQEVSNGDKREPNKAHVDAYFYNGETVFIFDPGSGYADWLYTAFNQDCEVICEFGGFAGLNTCPDFNEKAEYIGLIWEDPT